MITKEQVEALRGWFAGRLPEGLFVELLDVRVDREEITVIGRIPEPDLGAEASQAEREASLEGRISEFRERTRDERIGVAREAENRFGRKVSWGVECGDKRAMYTTVSAPVMTRLRQPERQTLDTLIAAWCRPEPQRCPGLVRTPGAAQRGHLAERPARLTRARPTGTGTGPGRRIGGWLTRPPARRPGQRSPRPQVADV